MSDKEKEDAAAVAAMMLEKCQTNPDAVLEWAEKEDLSLADKSFYKIAKASAYLGKAGVSVTLNGELMPKDIEATQEDIKYLEMALAEMKEDKTGLLDNIARLIESYKPGRVQELLGKTKLRYFLSGNRIGTIPPNISDVNLISPFIDVFFCAEKTVNYAILVVASGMISENGRYSMVILYDRRNPDGSVAGIEPIGTIFLCEDGSFSTEQPVITRKNEVKVSQSSEWRESEVQQPTERKGFFKRLFG